MSRKSDTARLYRVLELIDDAYEIVHRHGTLQETLDDKEGEYAVFMIISQIGEILGRIESEEYVAALPIREASGLRNVIVHDYEGVNRNRLAVLFDISLPELRAKIATLLA